MKFVEIYKIQNDGSQTIAAICKLAGETVVCEGEPVLISGLEQEGIWDDSKTPPQKVFPKDGLAFLDRLRFTFKSGYLNASEVKEE
ncbi:MAG: hypothetical protein WAP55_01445 [Minisyncoccia bacterium]